MILCSRSCRSGFRGYWQRDEFHGRGYLSSPHEYPRSALTKYSGCLIGREFCKLLTCITNRQWRQAHGHSLCCTYVVGLERPWSSSLFLPLNYFIHCSSAANRTFPFTILVVLRFHLVLAQHNQVDFVGSESKTWYRDRFLAILPNELTDIGLACSTKFPASAFTYAACTSSVIHNLQNDVNYKYRIEILFL